jgi:hypothetical protein
VRSRPTAADGSGDPQPMGEGDRNPLILPANISIDDPRVQFELTRYLSDNWVPVIEKGSPHTQADDVEVGSVPSNFNRSSVCVSSRFHQGEPVEPIL